MTTVLKNRPALGWSLDPTERRRTLVRIPHTTSRSFNLACTLESERRAWAGQPSLPPAQPDLGP